MQPLSASELLEVWERGLSRQPVERALLLLRAACPDIPVETLVQWSIGQRDTYLLMLRESLFGSELISLAACPGCDERLELAFQTADVRAPATGGVASASLAEAETDLFSLNVAGYQVRFRLPNSLDLSAIAGNDDIAVTRRRLLERCLVAASYHEAVQPVEQLPAEVVEAVAARLAEVDAQAEVQLALACPFCGHQWQATFDIVSFLWSEINTWAYRLLREVHSLAMAYGWREADILAMSPWRRQFYLEMISGA